jgi:hypothetical protein
MRGKVYRGRRAATTYMKLTLGKGVRFDRYSYAEMRNFAYLCLVQPLVSVPGGALSRKEC